MLDLMDAAVTAVFRKLSQRAELTALTPVAEHVTQDSPWPMTRIGGAESVPIGGKSAQLEEISVQVDTLYRGESPAEARAIMHQQRLALEGQAIEHQGVEFDRPEWAGAVIDGPAKDGLTYVGVQTFIIKAEPA